MRNAKKPYNVYKIATRSTTFAAAALTCLYLASAKPISASAISVQQLQSGRVYYIEVASSQKYLETANGASQDGTIVQQNNFSGMAGQKWRVVDVGNGYYTLESVTGAGDKALDVYGANQSNGAAIDIYSSNGTNAQRFKITYDQSAGAFSITTGATGGDKSLDIPGGSSDPGMHIQQYTSNSTLAQRFFFKSADDISQSYSRPTNIESGKVYYIRTYINGLYLSTRNNGDANGTGITQEKYAGTAAQEWRLTDASNGAYYVTNVGSYSGRTLDVPAASASNGVPLQLFDLNRSNAQQYKLQRNTDGSFSIYTGASNFSKCLDIPGASTQSGTYVQQFSANGTSAQKFILEQLNDTLNTSPTTTVTSGTEYYIQSAYSRLFLGPDGSADADSTGVTQNLRDLGTKQHWIFTKNSDGTYTIANEWGKVLDVAGGSNALGTRIQLFAPNSSNAQRWSVLPNSDGTVRLAAKCANNQSGLDINGMDSLPGEQIHLWQLNGHANQNWYLIPVTDSPTAVKDPAGGIISGTSSDLNNGLSLQGWAVNPSGIQNVSVYVDSTLSQGLIGTASLDSSVNKQPDYPGYAGSDQAGFSFSASPWSLSKLAAGTHTIYIVATGYDGTTQVQSFSQTYTTPMTVNAPSDTNIPQSLSFTGSLNTARIQTVSVYLGSTDSTHKIGDAGISGSTYSFSGTVDLTKAVPGPNQIVAVGYDSSGSAVAQQSFSMNEPGPLMNLDAVTLDSAYNSLEIKGWARNYSGAVPNISVLVDGRQLGTITPSLARSDVSSSQIGYFTNPGFDSTFSVTQVSNGTHSLVLQYTGDGGAVSTYSTSFTIRRPLVLSRPFNVTLQTMSDHCYYYTYYSDGSIKSKTNVPASDLDPTTIYNYDNISKYEFMSLYYLEGVTASDLNSMLVNCGSLTNQGNAFLIAAKNNNINPVYLVAHAKEETGNGGITSPSHLADGISFDGQYEYYVYQGTRVNLATATSPNYYPYKDGKSYYIAPGTTYYNYWGINADDGAASKNGGMYAAIKGWNSPAAAIEGGAEWLSSVYITGKNYSQSTLYEMKWNPYGVSIGKYNDQYATDAVSITDNWAYNIASIMARYSSIFGHTQPTYYVAQFNN